MIIDQLNKVKQEFPKVYRDSDDYYFNIVLMKNFFPNEHIDSANLEDKVVDGKGDGGIDFLFFDQDQEKLILGQSKYVEKITIDEIREIIFKVEETYTHFKKRNYLKYNEKLRKSLSNGIDSFNDNSVDNVELNIFVNASKIPDNKINGVLENISTKYLNDENIKIYFKDDIEERMTYNISKQKLIREDRLCMDSANNYLKYKNQKGFEGIMVNISSQSLLMLYNKYKNDGLFDINIRKYIKNKQVDDGIKKTLYKEPENFWFYNNGIIIACDNFNIDGNIIKLENFSIVNGGQTTSIIGENLSGDVDFSIPCKVISKEEADPLFYNKIAETTNSQKPIKARDLKSNAPEMIRLKNLIERNFDISFEIKRGEGHKPKVKYKISNEKFGQIVLAFKFIKPGMARNNKKNIFENNSIYNGIFKQNYTQNEGLEYIEDLIQLDDVVRKELIFIQENFDRQSDKNIAKFAHYFILSFFGIIYREVFDIDKSYNISSDKFNIEENYSEYRSFMKKNRKDNFINDLNKKIDFLVAQLAKVYEEEYKKGNTTSETNFFKSDEKFKKEFLSILENEFIYDEEKKKDFLNLFREQ